MRAAFVIALALLLPTPAHGGEDPPKPPPAVPPAAPAPVARPSPPLTPEQSADALLAAVGAKDDAALKVLAAKDDPDPWLVADELIDRGEFDAAALFAGAAPRVITEALPAYVAARPGRPDDAVRRARLAAVNVALRADRAGDALAALGAPEVPVPHDVVGVRLAFGRGLALRRTGAREADVRAFLDAADVAEAIGWVARAARALHEAAKTSEDRADLRVALAAWERTLKVRERIGDRSEVAAAHSRAGLLHQALGDLSKARACLDRALRIYVELGDRRGAARTHNNLGLVFLALGSYAQALEHQERALTDLESLGDRWALARTLHNVGLLHNGLGDHARARITIERALRLLEAGGDPWAASRAWRSLGQAHAGLGDTDAALRCLRHALELAERADDKAAVAMALGSIGDVHYRGGDYARALEHHERVLSIQEGIGDRLGLARARASVAVDAYHAGDLTRAATMLERVLRDAERLRSDPLLTWALETQARWQLTAGDARSALLNAKRAVPVLERMVAGLAEEQGATAREGHTRLFAAGAAASARLDQGPDLAYFLESGRAGTLMEALGGRIALDGAGLPETLRRAESAARAAEADAHARYTRALDGGDRAEIRARHDALDEARTAVVAVIERIQREAKRAASVFYPRAATIDELQSWLDTDEALVLFGICFDEALALVLTSAGARVVALGRAAAVVAACDALDAADPATDPGTAVRRLSKLLVAPLDLGGEVRRVLISPEGPLGYVPFSLLLPGKDVAFVPSGTTYGVLLEDRSARGRRVLGLGDPEYSANVDATALGVYARDRGARLVALPGTALEVGAVADVALLRRDATEAGFRVAVAQSDRWRAVHFACHGLVDVERPTLCSLALTPGRGDDGFLTALEVLRMAIPSDLVVLSACETGKGKIVGGEGIVGLTRAFMYAGSPRVICSLWKVDDEATKALMVKFYELWNPRDGEPGLPAAEALRKAQDFVKLQEKWKHPYYWAAWVLWGLPD